jgi:carbon-monoxide dehydrogenase medium subunit
VQSSGGGLSRGARGGSLRIGNIQYVLWSTRRTCVIKPASFDYFDPHTLPEAVALLSEYGDDAKILAGGQSLVPLLNMRLARPKVLVDLNRAADLAYVRLDHDGLAVGAMTRQRTIERHPAVAEHFPLLRDVVRWIGHSQIRARGTVGGSIAHADPAAELPAAALALEASIVVAGPTGTRIVRADDLFLGYLTTCLGPAEIITEVRFPALPASAGWSIQEVARRTGDFALVGVIAVVDVFAARVRRARLAYFGVGGRPVRLPSVERLLEDAIPNAATFEAAAHEACASVATDDDLHASASYRRDVAGTLTRRALAAAMAGSPASQQVGS